MYISKCVYVLVHFGKKVHEFVTLLLQLTEFLQGFVAVIQTRDPPHDAVLAILYQSDFYTMPLCTGARSRQLLRSLAQGQGRCSAQIEEAAAIVQ